MDSFMSKFKADHRWTRKSAGVPKWSAYTASKRFSATRKALALKKGTGNGNLTTTGARQLISLNRAVPADSGEVVYRITLPEDKDPASSFARDDRQQVKNIDDKSFELHVKAIRQPEPS